MTRTQIIAAAAWLAVGAMASSQSASAQNAAPIDDDAARFGALETASSLALSPDGKRLVLVGPGPGITTAALVVDLSTGAIREVLRADGKPMYLRQCDWSAADRLVCRLHGITDYGGVRLGLARTMAVNDDGSKAMQLGQQDTQLQYDGFVVDWLNGVDGQVLMARKILPERAGVRRSAQDGEGLGVDLIDTRTGKATKVEKADTLATDYVSDGRGTVRLRTMSSQMDDGTLRGVDRIYYRKAGSREWDLLGTERADDRSSVLTPLAVDAADDAAYVLQPLDGRLALYRMSLDGSKNKKLVLASPDVDIDNVVTVGRGSRVIGATWVTDRRQVEYFDPIYRSLTRAMAQAMPDLPLVQFLSTSTDERYVLVRASSDSDPGAYYVFDSDRRSFTQVLRARSPLAGKKLSAVRAVEYPAADGTRIPAYLTLPPGVTEAKGLPAIVMPHGGPEARDEWGFDWLAQFFAQRGYAVLQPNFRGSAGYGDAWFVKNGFQSWKISVGDICDAGKWLVAQGMADPAKLAVVGWSYGGYAALQANVLQPELFKATVAIAPVTDLGLLKTRALQYNTARITADFVGSGAHLSQGSPAENPAAFRAPVLMFHGVYDANVDIQHSRRMDRVLRAADRSSTLVEYPLLDHSLRDASARADMLRRSDAFLRQHLGL